MRIVLDTNVLVSALLSPFGSPGQLVRLITSGTIHLVIDDRSFAEYQEVLARPHFGFRQDRVQVLLSYLRSQAELITATPIDVQLPDEDDAAFLEVAVAAKVDFLVTGNRKHFPKRTMDRLGVTVLNPTEFLKLLRKRMPERPIGD